MRKIARTYILQKHKIPTWRTHDLCI